MIRDIVLVTVQERTTKKSPTGAIKSTWKNVQDIQMALYLTDELKNTQSLKYTESDYVGITFYNGLDKEKNRIIYNNEVYTLQKQPVGRLKKSVLLKKVKGNE